jgi:hypothetical protein
MIEINLLQDPFTRPCAHRASKVILINLQFRYIVLRVYCGPSMYNLRKVKNVLMGEPN